MGWSRCPLGQIHLVGLQLRRDQLLRQMDLKFLLSAFHCFCHGKQFTPFYECPTFLWGVCAPSYIQFQYHRAVVTARHLAPDVGIPDFLLQPL